MVWWQKLDEKILEYYEDRNPVEKTIVDTGDKMLDMFENEIQTKIRDRIENERKILLGKS